MGDEQVSTEKREKQNAWKTEAERQLRGRPLETLINMSNEGLAIKPLYDETDLEQDDTCGLYGNNHEWKISQMITAKDPKDLNEKIKYAKARGQNSFYLTEIDYIDHENAALDAFSSINWEKDSIFIDVGNNIAFTPFFFHHQKIDRKFKHIAGTIGFDPYEELLLEGKSRVSLETKIDFLADTLKWSITNKGSIRCLLIKGNIYSDAGANALQELVFTFSHALDLINQLMNRGMSIDQIARSLTISFGVGSNFFMEIAKLRAARDIWASLIHALGGSDQEHKVNLHAITTTYNKTAFDVHVNLLRTTTESFSAVISGVDEVTILPFDSIFRESSNLAERIARNTHFILKEEGLVSKVMDPSAGSYYVETLTKKLGTTAWEKIKQYDQEGGFLAKLKQGNIQHELEGMHGKRKADVNNRNKLIIGTNAFAISNEKVTVKNEENKLKTTNKLKDSVPSFKEAINYIEKEKRIPTIESEYQKELINLIPIKRQRLVEHFEELRYQAESEKIKGYTLKVGVITFGRLKDYKSCLDYISGMLAAGGIEVEQTSFKKSNTLSNVKVVILCGKTEDLQVIDPIYIQQLKSGHPSRHIYILGDQKGIVDKLKIAGQISMDEDMYQFLLNMHNILGVEKA